MIDLHCHMLPNIDDGARSMEMALNMARAAVADGITITACTPHIMPGVYDNTGPDIKNRIDELQNILTENDINLKLAIGADVHVDTTLVAGLKSGHIPTLNKSRYFLLEPPHNVYPPRLEDLVFNVKSAGYIPILTHPERLSWIEDHYDIILRLAQAGVPMQLTAGSVAGIFGKRIAYWCDRMFDDGIVSVLASDGHNLRSRPPVMSKARDLVATRLGEEIARNLTETWPRGVIDNLPFESLPAPGRAVAKKSFPKLRAWINEKLNSSL